MLKITTLLLLILTLSGCNHSSSEKPEDKVICFVSILPQSYFVKKIAGDLVEVSVLVGPGESPEKYDPSQKQLIQLSKAHCLFTIGIPFEKTLLKRISVYDVPIVATHANIEFLDGHCHHDDHDHDHHAHGGKDPHTWLDPTLVQKQIKIIAQKLVEILPEHTQLIEDNLKDLQKELSHLDAEISKMMSKLTHKHLWVYHPAYGYFCRRYGLEQVAVETEGKEPTGKQLVSLILKATDQKIRAVFVQRQFMAKSPHTFALEVTNKYKEKNIKQKCAVITIDPLTDEYSANLLSMAKSIYQYLK